MDWKKMSLQTILKKQKRSVKTLNSYRGIFVVPILSLIFEKLLKNRVTPCPEQNMTPFQTGGVKGNGITCSYLGELLIILNIFKRRYGLPFMTLRSAYDILNLIYKMNHKTEIVVKTPFGDCNPIFVENIVRQGTVLGPVLNNFSLDKSVMKVSLTKMELLT